MFSLLVTLQDLNYFTDFFSQRHSGCCHLYISVESNASRILLMASNASRTTRTSWETTDDDPLTSFSPGWSVGPDQKFCLQSLQTGGQTDRQTGRQTDRQVGRQVGRQVQVQVDLCVCSRPQSPSAASLSWSDRAETETEAVTAERRGGEERRN